MAELAVALRERGLDPREVARFLDRVVFSLFAEDVGLLPKLTVPDETLLALKGTSESGAAEVRLAAAVKLYEVGRLSSGAAATLAGRQSGIPIRDWAA